MARWPDCAVSQVAFGEVGALLTIEADGFVREIRQATDRILGASRERLQRIMVDNAAGSSSRGDFSQRRGKGAVQEVDSAAGSSKGDFSPRRGYCAAQEVDFCSRASSELPRRSLCPEALHSTLPPAVNSDYANEADSVHPPTTPPIYSTAKVHSALRAAGSTRTAVHSGIKAHLDLQIGTMNGGLKSSLSSNKIAGPSHDSMLSKVGSGASTTKQAMMQHSWTPPGSGMDVDVFAGRCDLTDPTFSALAQRPSTAGPRASAKQSSPVRPCSALAVRRAPPLPPLPSSLPTELPMGIVKEAQWNQCVEPIKIAADTDSDDVPTTPSPQSPRNSTKRRQSASRLNGRGSVWKTRVSILGQPLELFGRTSEHPNQGLFTSVEQVKAAVRSAVHREEYDVRNLYKDTGCWQAIAKHQAFEMTTLFVVLLNAIWMAVDADHNKTADGHPAVTLADSAPVFQVVENFACLYFTGELIVRFMAFNQKLDSFRDAWYVFDFVLVSFMIFETWLMAIFLELTAASLHDQKTKNATVLRILRILRVVRAARLVRVVKALPELMILVKGLLMAARSVALTALLVFLIIYVFAIAMTRVVEDSAPRNRYWYSVPVSMKTLFLHGCFLEGLPEVVNETGEASVVGATILLVFVMLASVTIMNMLVGVLCEVVQCVASIEKETIQVQYVKRRVLEVCRNIQCPGDCIGRFQFDMLLATPEAALALQDIGVDVVGLVDFGDFIFGTKNQITFNDFIDAVLQLRGSNTATVKDVVDVRKSFQSELSRVEQTLLAAVSTSVALKKNVAVISDVSKQ
eukprot:TRINITY_DN8483_c0_g3_i1.p1 TRINITY_DN8483_c0_g3~~TRINITY_DN8483_c0_g3_i1.p1  ORF type:complete len:800 (-),score=101.09 TRINITY_DN8483_c0_g3_i1:43-2442(-)